MKCLQHLHRKPGGIVVCYGAGVDSTAMLIAMHQAGTRPDLITFADTGGEKPETYDYIRDHMDPWLERAGFPAVTRCQLHTLDSTPYDTLEGNNLENQTLPSIAFGKKGCSVKWKQKPQDYYLMGVGRGPNQRAPHPLWLRYLETGQKITKLIGYDNSPADLRRSGRFAGGRGVAEDAQFKYDYPLQRLGWERGDCVATIVAAGLPVPIKSACWFCPASKKWELYWLAGHHPELFERALQMERTALVGKHSRFDEQALAAGISSGWEELVQSADRFPSTKTTVGLGRSFSWCHWAISNGIADTDYKVRRDRLDHCKQMAAAGSGEDNALDYRHHPQPQPQPTNLDLLLA